MRFVLKDYQAQAVSDILKKLARARDDYHGRDDLIALALSATTGAGKTVMAAAVLEALFEGSDDLEFDADPSAVVLWVTDDPSLNEQTRYRLIESGDQLEVSRLKVIEDGFDQEQLNANTVYFLNVQKLASGTSWVKTGNHRTYTLWEMIENTIRDESKTLYLVLDEAHRGMRSGGGARDAESMRSTIIQRLINGDNGVPPAPIVWGISATVQRFTDAMNAAQAEGRITYPPVTVDPKIVQESGLLKDTIILDFPDEKGAFETMLLRSAVRALRESSALWDDYAREEKMDSAIQPLMVLQVPNRPKDTDLVRMLDLIFEMWPELEPSGIAHVFGEHTNLSLGSHSVPYISPQNVEDATDVRILLAKDAVSTGWDCPRAEVLFSLRPAKDRTHITQLLGRMVRTPLARRVESDERLNSVTCFLPRFDFTTATDVAKVLTGEKVERNDISDYGKGSGRKALTSPVTMEWNSDVPTEVEQCLADLPSEAAPKAALKPIKRLLALSAEIALDELMQDPNEKAFDLMFSVLDGQLAQHRALVNKGVEDIYTAEIRRITSTVLGSSREDATYQEKADSRTVDDAFRAATRALGAAMAHAYAKQLATVQSGKDKEGLDIHAGKARLAALIAVDGVAEAIDQEAEKLANSWLNSLRTKIKSLGEERRMVYDEIKRQARDPQRVEIVPSKTQIENTRDSEDKLLPTRRMHLLADADGNFPVGTLNEWELSVVDAELGRDELVAWYRNPSASTANALQVPYLYGEKWKPMQPDFVFFSKKKDGSVAASIVDPHGAHLADALPKLLGLAAFAERYADDFLRIEAVAEVNGKGLRMLDLTDPDVRRSVGKAKDAKALYRGTSAVDYE